MRLEDQVCTLQQAKRLKELGVKRPCMFGWAEFKDRLGVPYYILDVVKVPDYDIEAYAGVQIDTYDEYLPAYTVAELGEMIHNIGLYTAVNTVLGGWAVHHVNDFVEFEFALGDNVNCFATEAEARAEIIIYLLKRKIINVNDLSS